MANSITAVGENVNYTMSGDKLIITIDTSQRGELSSTGKTRRVATTGGNTPIATPGGVVYLGLNAYVK